jgi:glycosyltransferase involved in cell wall biosynthesis
MSQSTVAINSLNKNVETMQGEIQTNKFGVCMLVTDLDSPTGGVQSISFCLLNELDKRGYKTLVCCRNYFNLQRNERRNGTLLHRTPTFNRFFVVFNSLSYLLDGLIWLIRHRDDYDIIHCQQIYAPAMLGLLAQTILRKPVVVAAHRSGELGEVNGLRKTPFRKLRVRQFHKANFWTVLSKEMQEEVESLGIPSKKIQLVPNATFIPKDAAYLSGIKNAYRAKLNLPYEQIVIFTGRLSAEKGLDVLVKAWEKIHKQNPLAHLLILGKGGGFPDIESEIKSLTNELKLNETIHFLGFKSNPTEYLLASDVFVLPSLTEGMSVALIEAMAAGLAIVTTDIPANEYLCQDNINSLLISIEDGDKLAEAVNNILRDPKLQERLGRAARERACQDLSVEVMADRYLNLYSKLIKDK